MWPKKKKLPVGDVICSLFVLVGMVVVGIAALASDAPIPEPKAEEPKNPNRKFVISNIPYYDQGEG